MKKILVLSLSLICTLTLAVSSAYSAPSDFNGDGMSDPLAVKIRDNGMLTWKVNFLLAPEAENLLKNFGANGMHIVPGSYAGTNKTQPAYVTSDGEWGVYDNSSSSRALPKVTFGAPKATYVAGADFDGNGLDDILYYTNRCKKKLPLAVNAMINPLGTAPVTIARELAKGHHITTYGDTNGNGKDEFCTLNPVKSGKTFTGRFTMQCYDLVTSQLVTEFNAGKVYTRPLPLKRGAGLPDYFAFPRSSKKTTSVKVKDVQGNLIVKISFPIKGDVMVGNYLGAGIYPEQPAIQSDAKLYVYDYESDAFAIIDIAPQIGVDDFNINTFDTTLDKCECDAKDIKKTGKCPKSSGCQVSRSRTDGTHGWLHKPVSDHAPHSPVNLLPAGEHATSCEYLNSAGGKLADAQYTGIANGGRQHWRPSPREGCGNFPSNMIFSCTISGVKNCWEIPDPCNRYD